MQRRGQALLIGLLIIFTSSVALAVAGAVVASSSVSLSQNQKLSSAAYNLASSCLSDTLMRMTRADVSEPAKLNVSGGNCTISITPSGGNYQISSTAEFDTVFQRKVTKKIQANVSVADGIVNLTSLQEVY